MADAPLLAELAADPERLDNLPDDELPEVLAALRELEARVWLRMRRPPERGSNGEPAKASDDDKMLNVQEAADILGVDERYVYDHADDWPFTRRLSPRKLRFSRAGLFRWLETRP